MFTRTHRSVSILTTTSLAAAAAALVPLGMGTMDASAEPPADPPAPPSTAPIVEVPDGAVEITDGALQVRLHPGFPQVVDYRLGGQQMSGRLGGALTSVLINKTEQPVKVTAPTVAADGRSATYGMTLPNLPGVSMDAVASVKDGVFRLTFTNLVDPKNDVNYLRIPGHNLVTVSSNDPASQISTGSISVKREISGDLFENIRATPAGDEKYSWMAVANNSSLAAAFATNSVEDFTTPEGEARRRDNNDNHRIVHRIVADGGVKHGGVSSGTWTWLSHAAEQYIDHPGALGRDPDPYVEVKVVADSNADGIIDWQDGAIAARDINPSGPGSERVANTVISRNPFNILSQATHPFLRALDETKRVSLETDNLGQHVMLKGYQAEGHDAAHPDFGGNYNERAGGLKDMTTLIDQGADWNAVFGVHLNYTESYSEARSFSEDLLYMPPRRAWDWMNQSYYIDGPKDVATGEALRRLQVLIDEKPDNLKWVFIDTYFPHGWEARRLSQEIVKRNLGVVGEYASTFPEVSWFSMWSNDPNYTAGKGITSDLIRFVHNNEKDLWNPHPILSNFEALQFEGWDGGLDHKKYLRNIWDRNLPTKFLQQSPIMKWEPHRIQFANGTVATSPLDKVEGEAVPYEREIMFDGATVYTGGRYLLPWKDGGSERLYHWNPAGGPSTWTLTDAWKSQESVTLFKLTNTGRVKVADVPVTDGQITLAAEAGVAYVVYPTSAVPEPREPDWGHGTYFKDPGFYSGTLAGYDTTGQVSVQPNPRDNFEAVMGAGPASLSQEMALPAGTWSAWAWVEIQPGREREVTVSASGDGVSPVGYAHGRAGEVTNSVRASTVMNATASDEKGGYWFQRVRVTFKSNGQPVTFRVSAGEGDAVVKVDDLRVVPFETASDPNPTPETVLFEDFEKVDIGYFPFVTGTYLGWGDINTQLARRHEPYSQKGWWGVNDKGDVVEGGKLTDNVLRGEYSLMTNNSVPGEFMKTGPGAIPFKVGHRYRISFDYQTSYGNHYRVRLGHDRVENGQKVTVNQQLHVLGEKRDTTRFSTELDACGINPFVAIDKLGEKGRTQHNLTIDDFRVEDLGPVEADCSGDTNLEFTQPAPESPRPTPAPTVTVDRPVPGPTVTATVTVTARPSQPGRPSQPAKPAQPSLIAPYEVPGLHFINGRQWNTRCEKYGQTQRCWTYIWARQVVMERGRYVIKEGWVFNNLTYLPYMTKAQWGRNPLANPGTFTSNGRQWRTECNTPATGRNGCRSYIWATVVDARPQGKGKYTFVKSNKWVFNNIVRFR